MMEAIAAAPLPGTEERLRWRDLLPVLFVTIAWLLVVFVSLVTLARIDRPFYRANLETIALGATLAIYLGFGAGLLAALRRLPDAPAFLGLRWPRPNDVGLVLALMIPWYLGIALVSAVSAALFNGGKVVPGNTRQLFIQHPRGIGILVLALLVTAVAAPVCEEVFFRGMLFRLLRTRMPLSAAVVLSAGAFALAHANPAISLALLPVFLYMGVVLAVLYTRTGVLTTTILLHGLNNAVGTVLIYVVLTR